MLGCIEGIGHRVSAEGGARSIAITASAGKLCMWHHDTAHERRGQRCTTSLREWAYAPLCRFAKASHFGDEDPYRRGCRRRAVHSLNVTAASRPDISELPNLLRENYQVVFSDAGYASVEHKRGARAQGIVWRVQDNKAKPKDSLEAALSGRQKKRNGRNSAIRARVEHLF
jgi:hypothetical protein